MSHPEGAVVTHTLQIANITLFQPSMGLIPWAFPGGQRIVGTVFAMVFLTYNFGWEPKSQTHPRRALVCVGI